MDKRVVENEGLFRSALVGLTRPQKRLDSKWFYDELGSELFEDITRLPEYYPTRTETAILRTRAGELERYVPEGAAMLELGSGASVKTRLLLSQFSGLMAYLPSDISEEFLFKTSQALAVDYPLIDVVPVVADFMDEIAVPAAYAETTKVVFFPGSTIGNLTADDAVALLRKVAGLSEVAAFIVGIDLVKDTDVLVTAYDDAAGVTADFNKNVLKRLNAECGADFDLAAFRHEARWNAEKSRIEMHLVSTKAQCVSLGGEELEFAAGESIHTENSHKYTRASFAALAGQAGWRLDAFLTDPDALFAVSVLVPSDN